MRIAWYGVVTLVGFFALNGIYQVIRKPGEVFAPIAPSLSKSPDATWRRYGATFERHSTEIIAPELLAALAQVEGAGNPVARTPWRWAWSWNPFEIYRPVSSAVGMFQITDGTFAEARKYCIHEHQLAAEGPWHDLRSCWFNRLYLRTLPSHATELTAAYLHSGVLRALGTRPATLTRSQQQNLAAVIHLCGLSRGKAFVRRGFRARPGERCGTHDLKAYLTKVDAMRKRFVRLKNAVG